MKALLFLPIALALSGCQTTPPPAPLPLACPPSLTQPLVNQPSVPELAGQMEVTSSPSSTQGYEALLSHLETLARWGRDGWARAATAAEYCGDITNG